MCHSLLPAWKCGSHISRDVPIGLCWCSLVWDDKIFYSFRHLRSVFPHLYDGNFLIDIWKSRTSKSVYEKIMIFEENSEKCMKIWKFRGTKNENSLKTPKLLSEVASLSTRNVQKYEPKISVIVKSFIKNQPLRGRDLRDSLHCVSTILLDAPTVGWLTSGDQDFPKMFSTHRNIVRVSLNRSSVFIAEMNSSRSVDNYFKIILSTDAWSQS